MPFSQAYETRDVERYLRILDPDFFWIRAETGTIETYESYSALIRESFDSLPAGISIRLEFRFTERICDAQRASERGIARMSGSGPRGPLPVRCNRFHTIAHRTEHGWRMLVDYDGGTVDEGEFDR